MIGGPTAGHRNYIGLNDVGVKSGSAWANLDILNNFVGLNARFLNSQSRPHRPDA